MRKEFLQPRRTFLRIFSGTLILMCVAGIFSRSAYAQSGGPPPCSVVYVGVTASEGANWVQTVAKITAHVTKEFAALETWYVDVFFEQAWKPAFQKMTAQVSAVAMQQTMIFGTFLDAKHQLETQQVLQKLSARAHKDYHPSTGLCEFGSGAKSLAASERKGEYNALILAQHAQDRAVGSAYTAAAESSRDISARFAQFKKKFCDPQDNNGGLQSICEPETVVMPPEDSPAPESKINKDIDFMRTVEMPWTLNVDFTDATVKDTDEEEVLALASNLYGHVVPPHVPVEYTIEGGKNVIRKEWKKSYMDLRAVLAKRSVAQNSYNAIVGMKSGGTAGSKQYLKALVEDLGVSPADAEKMIGKDPSYHAQMEILTKKIYQNPDFYTNLYDKPVNVARKGVALQAITLMQKFDLFKSYLRNEASLSVLLEIAIDEARDQLENKKD
ncbi:MAG: hypothetical protein ACT4OY_03870 [Alphaproteobacteria bacterium]